MFEMKWEFPYLSHLIASSSLFLLVSTITVLVLRLAVLWAWFWCTIFLLWDIEEDCFSGDRAVFFPPFDSMWFFKYGRKTIPFFVRFYISLYFSFFLALKSSFRSAYLEKSSHKYGLHGFEHTAGIRMTFN